MSEVFDYDALAAAGIETVVVKYNGSGDEGYIEEIESEPPIEGLDYGGELYREIEQVAYDVLETQYAGWEINEGSYGHITINVEKRTAFLHHGENEIKTNWYDTEV